MAGNDKSISFKFDIDSTSFLKAKQAIVELTGLLQNLAKVAGGITIPTGAGGAGGNFLSGIGVQTGRNTGMPQGQGIQKSNNVAGILTQGLSVDKQLFTTIASGSKAAMEAMTSSLKTAADRQIQDIRRLKAEIDSVSKAYNSLSAKSPWGSSSGPMSTETDAYNAHVGALGKDLSDTQRAHAQTQAMLGGSAGGIGQVGQVYKILGGIGAAAYAGFMAPFSLAARADNMVNSYEGANFTYRANLPLAQLQANANIGASIGGIGAGIARGDLASSMAYSTLNKNLTLKNIAYGRHDASQAVMAENYMTARDNFGQAFTDDLRRTGGGTGMQFGSIAGGEMLHQKEIAQNMGLMNVNAQTAAKMAQAVEAEKNRDPLTSQRVNDWFGGALQDLSIERGAHMAGRTWTDSDGTVKFLSGAGRAKKAAGAMGIDVGTYVGMRQAAGAEAGIANIGMGSSFWGAGVGGFAGAGSIFNAGQQFGGNGFYNAARGRGGISGSGGLDPVVGSQISHLVAKGMLSGGFGMGSEDALRGMGAMIHGIAGDDIGMQMRMSREAGIGENTRAAQLSGSTDALQGMINAYAGVQTFGSNYAAAAAMGKLNPTEMNQMLRKGAVGGDLGRLGVSIDDVRKYEATAGAFALSRTSDAMFGGVDSQARAAISGAREAGGDPLAYIAQKMKSDPSLKGKKLASLFRDLGTGISVGSGLSSVEETAALYNRASSDKSMFPNLKASGVGDFLSKNDETRKAVNAQTTLDQQKYDTVQGLAGKLAESMTEMVEMPNQLATMADSVMKSEKTLETALNDLADFIYKVVLKTKKPNDKPPERALPKDSEGNNVDFNESTAGMGVRK